MKEETKEVLEEIIEAEGKCFAVSRCKKCPIKRPCFSRYYLNNKSLLSPNERVTWAAATLFASDILDEELSEQDIEERFNADNK